MKRILILALGAAIAVAALEWGALRRVKYDNARLRRNQEVMAAEADTFRTRMGESAAGAAALTLKVGELERLREADAQELRNLRIRLRRAESVGRAATVSEVRFAAPLESVSDMAAAAVLRRTDNIPLAPPLSAVRRFRWSDRWTEVVGVVTDDSVHCTVASVDTLVQAVHRVPRRFLGIPFGTKAIRQEIVSKNPHTRVVYAEYIRLERRRRR